MENLCLVGADFHVRADLSHLPAFFCPAKSERNDSMEKQLACRKEVKRGSEIERDGELEKAKRERKGERV